MKYPSTGARFDAWLDSEWLDGTSWRQASATHINLMRSAFIAGVQSETDEIVDLQKQVHFWKQACDDAHNLGAERLKTATDTLEDVAEWIETGKVDGVGFDEGSVYGVIQDTLGKLA